jgi:hypothetical protein
MGKLMRKIWVGFAGRVKEEARGNRVVLASRDDLA